MINRATMIPCMRASEGIGDPREDPKTNTTSPSQWKQILLMNLSLPLRLNLSPYNWVLESILSIT